MSAVTPLPPSSQSATPFPWARTLRFRLALLYSAVSLTLLLLIGGGMLLFMLSQMDRQFQQRLNERADFIAERFTGKLDAAPPPFSGFTALVDKQGHLLALSKQLQEVQPFGEAQVGLPFRYLEKTSFQVADTHMRAVTRPAGNFGTVWVALPEDTLHAARDSALMAFGLSLVVAPLLMLLFGWTAGQRTLRGLTDAAEMAERIDPTHSLEQLPLPRHQDEVYRLLEAINRLLKGIENEQQREKQLLGQIVHELGAPLTVLKASLVKASQETAHPDVQRAALVADELTFTTQDLMQLARGQLDFKLAWHYISAHTLLQRLDRLVPNIQFSGEWESGILCDPDRLTQAIRNLLANARRAAGPEGEVRCYLHENEQWLTFTVRDNGPGLPPELGEQIFAPFVSGAGSSGLGLSVSRQIAQMHGGDLVGHNHATGGAEFILTIPNAALSDEDETTDDDN